ncbi:RNA polymerase sigma factor SigM [Gordonia sp. CPCC 205333]|uniref:RNA polymerase sigma factor SigM n=1 Tax=Gordonia sp. CPCC 205333 TaxID=3140790 RepID=UPI003AF3D28D
MTWGDNCDGRTDEQLLDAHIAGETGAFATLIERHQRRLLAIAYRTTNNPEDAHDALQDALLNAHCMAKHYRAEAKVISWLHRIVVNACLDRIRRNKSHRTIPIPEFDVLPLADPHDHTTDVDLAVSVGHALNLLPPDQRAAVVAVDVEGLPVNEAAARLGVPTGTIKSRCSRGRLKLAALLGHLQEPV